MTVTRLTPEQVRELSASVARFLTSVRRMFERLAAMIRPALRAALELVERMRRSPALAAAGPSRPAWMSPYGPPARRRH